MDVLGPPTERERFYLIPEPVPVRITPADRAFTSAREISLYDYLDDPKARSDNAVDISGRFDDPPQLQRWQHKTAQVMTETAAFLRWIDDWLRARPGIIPVSLLRDILLIVLGLDVAGAATSARVEQQDLLQFVEHPSLESLDRGGRRLPRAARTGNWQF